jgi:hypothetical protein
MSARGLRRCGAQPRHRRRHLMQAHRNHRTRRETGRTGRRARPIGAGITRESAARLLVSWPGQAPWVSGQAVGRRKFSPAGLCPIRHGRACPGHLRFNGGARMAGTRPAMTVRWKPLLLSTPYPDTHGDKPGHDTGAISAPPTLIPAPMRVRPRPSLPIQGATPRTLRPVAPPIPLPPRLADPAVGRAPRSPPTRRVRRRGSAGR